MSDYLTLIVALLGAANAAFAGLTYQAVKADRSNKTAQLTMGLNTLAAIGCALAVAVRA